LSPCVDKIVEDHQCGFDVIYQPLTFANTGEKMRVQRDVTSASRMPMINLGGKYCKIFSYCLEYPRNWLGWLNCV
jgi:hypothetical protein